MYFIDNSPRIACYYIGGTLLYFYVQWMYFIDNSPRVASHYFGK